MRKRTGYGGPCGCALVVALCAASGCDTGREVSVGVTATPSMPPAPRDGGVPTHADAATSTRSTRTGGVNAPVPTPSPEPEREVAPEDAGTDRSEDAGARIRGWTTYGFDQANSQVNPDAFGFDRENASQLREKWRYQFAEGATSTPAVYDGAVYFADWNGHFYAADAQTGELIWQQRVADVVRSSPLVIEDRVFVAAATSLFALDRADGHILYETKLDRNALAFVDSSPKFVDGMLIIGVASAQNALPADRSFHGNVVAIDADSGQELWRVWTTGEPNPRCRGGAGAAVWSSAAIDEQLGLAFIGTGQAYEQPMSPCSCALLALHYRRDFSGDRLAWVAQFTEDVWNTYEEIGGKDADIGASPNLFEAQGRPVVGVGDKPGSYRVFDRRTGALVWRTDLEVGTTAAYGGVMTTAAVHDGSIYVSSNRMYPDLFVPEATRFESTIFALDTETGATRWSVPLADASMGSFAVAGELLFHGDAGGRIYARELATGTQVWSGAVASRIGNVSVAGDRLYVSAGWGITGTGESEQDGVVASFGFGDGPRVVWEPSPTPRKPLSVAECRAAISNAEAWSVAERPSDDCSSCLCECDPTSAGYCNQCWLFVPCAQLLCSETEPGDATRICLNESCPGKLLPNFLFESQVEVVPCVRKCAASCGW